MNQRANKVNVNIGEKHEHLTVVEYTWHTQPSGQKVRALKCQCDCGGTAVVVIYDWGKKRSGCAECQYERGRHSGRTTEFAASTYAASAKRGANKRGKKWDITTAEYAYWLSKPCHYCGGKTSGVDRVDSHIGYALDNVVPCCYACNKAKSIMSVEEFADWVSKVHAHMLATNWKQQYVVPTQRLFGD